MSKERAELALNLKMADKIPQVEWFSGMAPEIIEKLTGINPYENAEEAFYKVLVLLDADMIWGNLPTKETETFRWAPGEGIKRDKAGKIVSRWGIFGTTSQEDGAHLKIQGINSVDDVYRFNPLLYMNKSAGELSHEFRKTYIKNQNTVGGKALALQNHYTTLFHWPLSLFGWELFMEAAALDSERFGKLLEKFAELSIRIMTAWSTVNDIPAFISHDDLCMTQGPVFRPDWYRKYIFPFYPKIWKSLKDKGIKILFCSDGDITCFIDDIANAGADGFIIEALVDLEYLVKRYGDSKVIIGGIDTKVLSTGSKDDIVEEVERCVKIGGKYPGYCLNASGGLTHDIPYDNLIVYLETCKRVRKR